MQLEKLVSKVYFKVSLCLRHSKTNISMLKEISGDCHKRVVMNRDRRSSRLRRCPHSLRPHSPPRQHWSWMDIPGHSPCRNHTWRTVCMNRSQANSVQRSPVWLWLFVGASNVWWKLTLKNKPYYNLQGVIYWLRLYYKVIAFRCQPPRALWSAGERPERVWGNGIIIIINIIITLLVACIIIGDRLSVCHPLYSEKNPVFFFFFLTVRRLRLIFLQRFQPASTR